MLKIVDAHCDLLDKMLEYPDIDFNQNHARADVSLPRLKEAGVILQMFAVFLDERGRIDFQTVLNAIDLFYRKIARNPDVVFIRSRSGLEEALAKHKLGAVLTLEGADGLEGNLTYLRTVFHLGVRLLGITWNHANWAADGVMEPRKGGFTVKGFQLVRECEKLGIILDVSHLSEAGFWQLADAAARPFVATHSNARSICPHPRNLTDEQIKAIVLSKGMIGLTFVPWFVKTEEPLIRDILSHIDKVCSLGGSANLGFGSDFDGIDRHIPGLEHPGHYTRLVDELLKHYSSSEAEAFLSGNWRRFLSENLPG